VARANGLFVKTHVVPEESVYFNKIDYPNSALLSAPVAVDRKQEHRTNKALFRVEFILGRELTVEFRPG
jgi:hypothetical protein